MFFFRKISQHPSTTDGEYSSSLLSCPYNGLSSSTSDLDRLHNHHHTNPSSLTVSTLTRKSIRRPSTKNVSFQPTIINPTNNIFNDLFQNTSSTFNTLSKEIKCDTSDFPTLQTILYQSTKLPQPPPLLNGILLLDQMLTKSTDEKNSTVITNHDWYTTRASIV